MKKSLNILICYIKNPPKPPNDCGCRMHKFFYNEEKLKELKRL